MQEDAKMQHKQNSPQPLNASTPDKLHKKKRSAALCLWLALLVLATGACLYFWQTLRVEKQRHLSDQKQLSGMKQLLSAVQQTTAETPPAIAIQAATPAHSAQPATLPTSNPVLSEADYLVQLADFHLVFEQNTQLARRLLAAADARLATDNSPAFWPLRRALAEDMATLDAASTVDLPGLVARLGGLMQEAETLPKTPLLSSDQKEAEEIPPTQETTSSDTTAASSTSQFSAALHTVLEELGKISKSIGSALSQMVIVSKGDAKMPVLLTTEQHTFLITNIQSQLSLAEWAAVHRQEKIYAQSVAQVASWLNTYFSTDHPVVKSMLQALDELKIVSVNPEIPELSHSMEVLKTKK